MENSIFNVVTLIIIAVILVLLIFKNELIKAWKRDYRFRQAKHLFNKKLPSIEHDGQLINYLRKVDPFVFEELILLGFKQKGYKVKRNEAYTGDGGIDGTIFDKQGRKILIQAKRYQSSITPSHVQEFAKVIQRENAYRGYFVHTGRTGDKSHGHAKGQNIEFYSGSKLTSLIKK